MDTLYQLERKKQQMGVIKELRKHPKLNGSTKAKEGWTSLSFTAERLCRDVVEVLLNKQW